MTHERITQHEDWKDGMDAFRLQVMETLAIVNKEIKNIKQQIKETP